VEALQIPHSGSTSGAFLTISIGCASTIPQRGDSFVPLLATADAALYEAKESGKNRVVVRDHDRDKDHPPDAAGPVPTGESPS
jgi:two-component system chemotaxis family response regulator WspR